MRRKDAPAKPTQAPEQKHSMGGRCFCAPKDLGMMGGMRAWKHHDPRGDFISSVPTKTMTTKEARAALGRRIQQLRRDKGTTQRELASALDITPHHVYLLEAGKIGPSVGMLQSVAEAFGTTETELLHGAGEIRFPKRGT